MFRLLPNTRVTAFVLRNNLLGHLRKMSDKKVLAIVTEGTEEMELVISVDVLRRAGVCTF